MQTPCSVRGAWSRATLRCLRAASSIAVLRLLHDTVSQLRFQLANFFTLAQEKDDCNEKEN